MSNKKTDLFTNVILIFMVTILSVFIFYEPYKIVFTNNNNYVFYNGDKSKNNVTLMFNVYWGNDYIEPIINEFKSRNLKTTFFIGGVWANKYPELLNKIYLSGNELGNHGYNHKEHSKLTYQENQEEILKTNNLIYEKCGVNINIFAPPSGDFNDITISSAYNLGCYTILWTRDTIDWRDQDSDLIYSRAIKDLANGDLILLHPTKATLSALPKILDYCISHNYNVTTVSENLAL